MFRINADDVFLYKLRGKCIVVVHVSVGVYIGVHCVEYENFRTMTDVYIQQPASSSNLCSLKFQQTRNIWTDTHCCVLLLK